MVNLSNVEIFCEALPMGTDRETGAELLALKERSGMSLRQIAAAAGYRGASSIQRYFSDEYNGQYLPPDVAARIAKAMAGKGKPPIREEEITDLAAYALATPGLSAALAEAFVRHIAQKFGAVVARDDPEVIRLAKFLQALLKLTASRQVTDADDLIAGLFAGADILGHNGSDR